MRKGDTQLGTPYVEYADTKANIEALAGIAEGAHAYATDTDEPGWFDGAAWVWGTGGTPDAADVTYTPTTAADWDGDADPGDVDNALDQLAERVDDLEGTPPGSPDASDVTYTPTVNTDWDSDADPGDVDNALDQLAERVDDLEGAAPGAPDAADVTYTPTTATDWDSDADPGNVDDALDQLAERVDDIEGAGGHDAVTLDANVDNILELSNQEIGLDDQDANTVLAGPTTGAADKPAFRALVTADIPIGIGVSSICQGRLTLESGVPVSTSDQTAKTTLYFTPFKGNLVGLYNGTSSWTIYPFSQLSLDISGYTADKNYDIWIYDNAGTPTLDSTIWTDDTTRATALALQDGIYIKTGDTTRRYLGTIRITSSAGQCADSVLTRYVWNYYNRCTRSMGKRDSNNHSYTTGAYRSWNNDATIRLQFVIGVVEEVNLVIYGGMQETSSTSVGYDVTNTDSTGGRSLNQLAPTAVTAAFNTWNHYPGIGFHYYQAVEYGATGATQTNVTIDAVIMG